MWKIRKVSKNQRSNDFLQNTVLNESLRGLSYYRVLPQCQFDVFDENFTLSGLDIYFIQNEIEKRQFETLNYFNFSRKLFQIQLSLVISETNFIQYKIQIYYF